MLSDIFCRVFVEGKNSCYCPGVALKLRIVDVLLQYFGLKRVTVVDLKDSLKQWQYSCNFVYTLRPSISSVGHQHDMILCQFIHTNSACLSVLDMPREDASGWEDYNSRTLHFPSNPLSHTEEVIFIDKDADTVRKLIFELALVPSVSKIYDRVHYIFI